MAGTSCPRPSLEHPAPSFAQRMKPPLLQAGTFVLKGPSYELSLKPLLQRIAGILPAWAPAAMVSAPRGRVALPDGPTFDFETFDALPLHRCRRARQECRASLASRLFILLSSLPTEHLNLKTSSSTSMFNVRCWMFNVHPSSYQAGRCVSRVGFVGLPSRTLWICFTMACTISRLLEVIQSTG